MRTHPRRYHQAQLVRKPEKTSANIEFFHVAQYFAIARVLSHCTVLRLNVELPSATYVQGWPDAFTLSA